jgi:hypothetical protein
MIGVLEGSLRPYTTAASSIDVHDVHRAGQEIFGYGEIQSQKEFLKLPSAVSYRCWGLQKVGISS